MAGTLFPITGDARLIAHPGSKIANHQTNRQHHGKGQQILHVRNGERTAWRDKKEIETRHVNHRRHHRRPASVKQRNHHYAQQIEHHQIGGVEGDKPLHSDKRGDGAKRHGDQTALNLPTPFLFKRSVIRRLRQRAGRRFFQRDDHLIEIRRAPGKTVGESVTSPPTSRRRAAHDDFPQIMFAGIAHDRFLFGGIGQGGGFRAKLLRQAQRA